MVSRSGWLVLWSLWLARQARQPSPVVRVPQGLLRGQLAPDGSHYQYFGIPYATSQLQFRFQAPGPAPTWQGVFEAVDEHIKCPQLYGTNLVLGPEDCLVLNVYSPVHAHSQTPVPVMVFIHGGGFKEGSGSRLLYGPDYLVSRGVILVTFNYRLGVHGFVCLGTKEVPGNAGLKDQVAAFRWVRRNIRAFGGDPDNITIFGESAGAASVSYHLVSPQSRGLFHKAIMQSGSSTASWAHQPHPLRLAIDLAKALGYNVEDPQELSKIFINETLSNLFTAEIPRKGGQLNYIHIPYKPCVERRGDPHAFITDLPFNILTRGEYNKVPVVIGANDHEGYYFASHEDEESLNRMRFEDSLPSDLEFPTAEERQAAAQRVKRAYMDEDEVSLDTLVKLSQFIGEHNFNFPALVETELILQTSDQPVYSYIFEYSGWRNFPKLVSGARFWMSEGASHADDLFYLFSLFPLPSLFENHMINIMTTLWTNFAKYGEPRGESWAPAGRAAPLALYVGARPRTRPLHARRPRHARLWRSLYAAYRAGANRTDTAANL